MSPIHECLVRQLMDGRSHSGEALAKGAGQTRAAVWKQVRKLEDWGLEVIAERGKGYRLEFPIELLDAQQLTRDFREMGICDLDQVEIFTELDSTNQYLAKNRPQRSNAMRICCAEYQSAGRGRRMRNWSAPFGSGVFMSCAWSFDTSPAELASLSLVTGVAAARAIQSVCGLDIELKWPNDLVVNERKLGGILVESTAESHGACHVIIGIGVNVSVSDDLLSKVSDWRDGAIDLRTANSGKVPSRNALVFALACELGKCLSAWERDGNGAYLQEWRSRDYLSDRPVKLINVSTPIIGHARGIADDGALLIEDESGAISSIRAGEVSVRIQ